MRVGPREFSSAQESRAVEKARVKLAKLFSQIDEKITPTALNTVKATIRETVANLTAQPGRIKLKNPKEHKSVESQFKNVSGKVSG